MNKRIALAEYPSDGTPNLGTYNHKLKSIPGKQATSLAACEMLGGKTSMQAESINKNKNQFDPTLSSRGSQGSAGTSVCSQLNIANCSSFPAVVEASEVVGQQHLNYWERRETELKFTAAGWKRDCHGKWYKDENVSILLCTNALIL